MAPAGLSMTPVGLPEPSSPLSTLSTSRHMTSAGLAPSPSLPPAPAAVAGEHIHSSTPLERALRAAITSLQDQLQVLSILDGSTALAWPGVGGAHAHLAALVESTSSHVRELEQQKKAAEATATRLKGSTAQLTSKLKAAATAQQQAHDQIAELRGSTSTLRKQADDADAAAQQAHSQVQALQHERAQLVAQLSSSRSNAGVLEHEVRSVKDQLSTLQRHAAAQQEQLAAAQQQAAVSAAELSHTAAALQDSQEALAQMRSELAALQHAFAREQAGKHQCEGEVGRLSQERDHLAATLRQAEAEAARLREFQDVSRRMAGAKARELQDANACAAAAQAAAIHKHRTKVDALQWQLQQAELGLQQARASHAAAALAAGDAASAERASLVAQLDEARCDAAVKSALCDGWQRANHILADKARQQEALVQRLQREADAGAQESWRLRASTLTSHTRPDIVPATADIYQQLQHLQLAMQSISGSLLATEATIRQVAGSSCQNL